MSSGVIIIKNGKKYKTNQNNNSNMENVIGNLANKELLKNGKNTNENFIIYNKNLITLSNNYYLIFVLFLLLLIIILK